MAQITRRTFIALLAAALLCCLGGLFMYPLLPSLLPANWGISGQITQWRPKQYLLPLLFLPLLIVLVFKVLPLFDPRKSNYQKHARAYGFSAAAISLMLSGFCWLVILFGLGIRVPFPSLIIAFIGVALLILGNYMPQIRSNFFIGFRTPWTLDSETVWRKTHRLAGVLTFALGVFLLAGAFFPGQLVFWAAITGAACTIIVPTVYSYTLYRKIKEAP